MNSVWITDVAVAHPDNRISQADAAKRIGEVSGEPRRVRAIAKGTLIAQRSISVPHEAISSLGSIEDRNQVYLEQAPQIAYKAASSLLKNSEARPVGFLATSSCTGYMVPGLDVGLAAALHLHSSTVRLPITEAGCAGGVVSIARATDYLRVHPGSSGLVVAVELCSLAFHADPDLGNLMSTLLFGDGAGAALLQSGDDLEYGLEIVDSSSHLVPDSQDALGFALTDQGFYPLLTRELADLLPKPTEAAVGQLLRRHKLCLDDISFCLVHPGGSKILRKLGGALGIAPPKLSWSWQSLQEFGNTSSAAIFDVLRRFLEDSAAPAGWGLVIAFGPGVSIELLLVRRC